MTSGHCFDHPRIAWKPHVGQLQVAENNCRHKVVCAGRRWGKSSMGGYALLPEVFYTKPIASTLLAEGKRRIFWIVGPCVDRETEILTQRGWLCWYQVEVGDLTLGVTESGTAEWTEIEAVNITVPQQRQMVSIEMRGHSSLTTPNHKWLTEYTTQNYGDGQTHVLGTRFVESSDLGIKSNERVPCARPVINLPEMSKYTDALVELVGWYWTEGTLRKDGGICIAQDDIANPGKVKRIGGCIKTLFGYEPYYNKGKEYYIRSDLAEEIKVHAIGKDKALQWGFITSLTQSQLELFMRVACWADGSWRDRGTKGIEAVVVQKRKYNLDVLQVVCQLAGFQTNLKHYPSKPSCPWVLQIFTRNHFYPSSARRSDKPHSKGGYQIVDYDDVVWCPTTGTRTWLARRNGTVYFTGNSYSDSEKEFRVIWDLCRKLGIPMEKGSFNSPETGLMQIRLWGGAMEIVAKSSQVPERLVGEGLSGVIMAEAAKMKETIWPKFIRPTLADFNGWSLHTSTPEGKVNWFYDLWRSAQDPNNTQWASWRMPAWTNHYVYKTPTVESDVMKLLDIQNNSYESVYKLAKQHNLVIDSEILDSINELTSQAFLQELGASFSEFVGAVFPEFDEEVHVTDLVYNPGWQTVAAVDYG